MNAVFIYLGLGQVQKGSSQAGPIVRHTLDVSPTLHHSHAYIYPTGIDEPKGF